MAPSRCNSPSNPSITMRFSTTTLFALSSVLSFATSTELYPDCATTCIRNAEFGGCSSTDNTCLCKSFSFVNSTRSCFEATCNSGDYDTAMGTSAALCTAVGVTATPLPEDATSTSSADSSERTDDNSAVSQSLYSMTSVTSTILIIVVAACL
ncbi:hypothetical protein CPB85DRAFT_862369 [Mucidula mucida]|nr:hypothetical protein CPB85DRAFT_862369 [Mucidula mucida]